MKSRMTYKDAAIFGKMLERSLKYNREGPVTFQLNNEYARELSEYLNYMNKKYFKKHKWIQMDKSNEDLWVCSECHQAQQLFEGTPEDNEWYYCPHCGAKMGK